jgi:hypothetical protein
MARVVVLPAHGDGKACRRLQRAALAFNRAAPGALVAGAIWDRCMIMFHMLDYIRCII